MSAYEAGQPAQSAEQVDAQGASFSTQESGVVLSFTPSYMHTRHVAGEAESWSRNEYMGRPTPTGTMPVTLCTTERLLSDVVARTGGIPAIARLDERGVARVIFSRERDLFRPVPSGEEVPISSYDAYLASQGEADFVKEVGVSFPHPLNRGEMAFAAGAVVLGWRGRSFSPVPSTIISFHEGWGLNRLSFVR